MSCESSVRNAASIICLIAITMDFTKLREMTFQLVKTKLPELWCSSWLSLYSSVTVSLPLRVIRSLTVSGTIVSDKNRTEPSARATLAPPE